MPRHGPFASETPSWPPRSSPWCQRPPDVSGSFGQVESQQSSLTQPPAHASNVSAALKDSVQTRMPRSPPHGFAAGAARSKPQSHQLRRELLWPPPQHSRPHAAHAATEALSQPQLPQRHLQLSPASPRATRRAPAGHAARPWLRWLDCVPLGFAIQQHALKRPPGRALPPWSGAARTRRRAAPTPPVVKPQLPEASVWCQSPLHATMQRGPGTSFEPLAGAPRTHASSTEPEPLSDLLAETTE
mmetsp:Transcript_63267/g.119762  ORF Transcript_63267/g.119762 Transcript_63267/m.119762 type:complete len:244 (-) Transcript_63267:154-885(-)